MDAIEKECEQYMESRISALQKVVEYCLLTTCRRRFLLQYFGEAASSSRVLASSTCCDICTDPKCSHAIRHGGRASGGSRYSGISKAVAQEDIDPYDDYDHAQAHSAGLYSVHDEKKRVEAIEQKKGSSMWRAASRQASTYDERLRALERMERQEASAQPVSKIGMLMKKHFGEKPSGHQASSSAGTKLGLGFSSAKDMLTTSGASAPGQKRLAYHVDSVDDEEDGDEKVLELAKRSRQSKGSSSLGNLRQSTLSFTNSSKK
jgi:superfamily II DNA helicase RecQ